MGAKINLRMWRARCNDTRGVEKNCSGFAADLRAIFGVWSLPITTLKMPPN
jgi:hypothetical protein